MTTGRWLVLAAISVALGVGGFLLSRIMPEVFPTTDRLEVDADCDLRSGRCVRDLPDGGRLGFRVTPSDLPLMRPLELEVRLSGTEADGVLVDIVGLNMDMGINRTRLQAVAPGLWRGSTALPVCSRSTMRWEAAVWLERGGHILAVPHHFETHR